MKTRLILLLPTCAAAAFGQYAWDYAKNPVVSDSTRWNSNGSVTFTSGGVTFASSGSLISKLPISVESGGNQNDYEVDTKVSLQGGGGGVFIHFLRANSNTVQPGSGTYIAVKLKLPSGFTSPGAATIDVSSCTGGTSTDISSNAITAVDGMTLRSIIYGTTLMVLGTNNLPIWQGTVPSSITTGNPGIGGLNIPSGAGFTSVLLGHHDTVAPGQVPATSVVSSVFPTSASLRWQGVVDDQPGIGLWMYDVVRNGVYIESVAEPEFTDSTVAPSTTYSYGIYALDFHGNYSTLTTFSVTTPPTGAIDPRRTGVRTTGSYWGGGGEQIDTLSGNVNFSLPLLQAQARSGWSVPVGLTYNSQNWRNDNGVYWKLGNDVGFGFGWQMLIGSITPYYTNLWGATDHYVFTDSTGAQYRLDQNNSGIWSSSQGIYVWFDSNQDVLHFKDGSFWVMGSTSGGTEQDAGTMYPTTLEDSNGNQVIVTYQTGGLSPIIGNSSARMVSIEDDRAQGSPRETYNFTYAFNQGPDPFPHLQSISNTISTPESYSFQMGSYALNAPFSPTGSFGSSYVLSTVTHTTVNTQNRFYYDSGGAGELVQASLPDGGILTWQYVPFTYSNSRTLREVSTSSSQQSSAGMALSYNFSHNDSGNPNPTVHASTSLQDGSGSQKNWTFITQNTYGSQAWQMGLLSTYQDIASTGSSLRAQTYTWTTDTGNASGNPYISQSLTQYNPGQSYESDTTSTQTLDTYGNATVQKLYDYGNAGTPLRTWTSTYLHTGNSNYDNNFIRNRLVSASVTDSSNNTTPLVANTYDGSTPAAVTGTIYEFDASNAGRGNIRGNLTQTVSLGATATFTYDATGHALTGGGANGTGTSAAYSATTNYATPAAITPMAGTADVSNGHPITQASGSQLASSYGYTTALGLASAVMPNSATASQTFDPTTGLLSSSVSVNGATTNYSYTFNPTVVTATTNQHWSKDYRDGFGRSIASEAGNYGNIVSHADTVYGAAAGLPFGQAIQTSSPYAISSSGQKTASDGTGNVASTTFTFDGLGRTLTSVAPDSSATQYVYQGNTTKVTDPAGNWKRFTTDALGNMVQVTEPNPQYGQTDSNSTNFQTYYSYDVEGHLTQAQMPRPTASGTVTQTRSFNYNLSTGQLTSTTNPESGTVSYAYYASGRLLSKTDAKNQKVIYSYDGYGRPAYIDRYAHATDIYPDPCQSVALTYDAGTNGLGHLTSASWGWGMDTTYCGGNWVEEQYQYSPGGLVTWKAYSIGVAGQSLGSGLYQQSYSYGPAANFSYDNEGHMTGYGVYGSAFSYTLDAMGRPTALTETGPGTVWVQNVSYGPGGEMKSMQYRTSGGSYYTENRGYNSDTQLIGLQTSGTGLTGINLQYAYPSGNAGRIAQTTNATSGEQITYAYDALNRLSQATAGTSWGQSFTYDGFGNLTGKTVTAGSAPYMSLTVDATTNHVTTSGFQYDLNGNATNMANLSSALVYDIENRTGSSTIMYPGLYYDLENQPLDRGGQWNVYGLHGERLATYTYSQQCGFQGNLNVCVVSGTQTSRNIYFGGRLIQSNGTTVVLDRQGSVRANESGQTFEYFPYGEEMGTTANDREKFATYTRESATGLDYADQRYYSSVYGTFTSSDPLHQSATSPADATSPGSWNRYSYAGGDPINRIDPTGNFACTGSLDGIDVACTPGGTVGGPTYSGCAADGSVDTSGPNDCYSLNNGVWQQVDTQHVTPTEETCGVTLFTRPVAESYGVGSHSFLEVSFVFGASQNEETLEGGPTNPGNLSNPGLLRSFNTPNGYNYPADAAGVAQGAGLHPISCTEASTVIDDSISFYTSSTYQFRGYSGPNSNSFLSWLISTSGLGSIFPNAPWGSFGWNTSVNAAPGFNPAPGPGKGGILPTPVPITPGRGVVI